MQRLLFFTLLLLSGIAMSANPQLESEIRKLDSVAADPDGRVIVVTAMAGQLHVHRNHLALLRKQTGQSYGRIFVSSLQREGVPEPAILQRIQALNREVESQWRAYRQVPSESGAPAPRPVLSLAGGVDHNSAGTLTSLTPEIGIDSRRASLVVGIPYYRSSAAGSLTSGVGDVYAAGTLRGSVSPLQFDSNLTIGFPTGDRNAGLGAGKVTADVTETVSGTLAGLRPFVSAGLANSILNNVGYVRPYISDGNALHLSGGIEFRAHRLTAGVGAFALRPFGSQLVYGRTAAQTTAGTTSGLTGGAGGGMGNMGGTGGMPPAPGGGQSNMPGFAMAHGLSVEAASLQDDGPNAWASLQLFRGAYLNVAVARSLPFAITTVRAGVAFDLARMLFPGKHF